MSTLDLEYVSSRNARSQLQEAEQARLHLQGVYPGDVLSTLTSTATSAQTRRDWAETALRAYSNAISLDPSLAEAYVGRAAVYRYLERYADARADLQHAEKLGIADATQEVGQVEHRLRMRRLVLVGVSILVTGACALWIFYRPTPPEIAASKGESVPSPPASALVEQKQAVAPPPPAPVPVSPPIARPASPSVAGNCSGGSPCPDPRTIAPPTAAPAAVKPPVVAATPVVAAAPAVAAPAEPRPQEPSCQECDSVIAALPEAAPLAKEDLEMTRLACRSSEGSGADAYRACVVAQIVLLDAALPMPDLSVLPPIDRQLLQRTCASATHNGPAAYRRCVTSQLIGLAGAPELPDTSGLSPERKRAVDLACRTAAEGGVAAYHNCLDRQVRAARRAPSSAPPAHNLSTNP